MRVNFIFILAVLITLSACGGGGGGPDKKAPTVAPGTPVADEIDVSRNIAVTAVFSEAMNSSTIDDTTFTLVDSLMAPVAGTVSYSGEIATFTPTAAAPSLAINEIYTATITTGVEDSAGNPLASDFSWSFTTTLIDYTVLISWNANPETAVNRTGGGYKVYYSLNPGFAITDPTGVLVEDVPYVTGLSAPTSVQLVLVPDRYYFRVVAYSALNAPGTSGGSMSTAAPEFALDVPK